MTARTLHESWDDAYVVAPVLQTSEVLSPPDEVVPPETEPSELEQDAAVRQTVPAKGNQQVEHAPCARSDPPEHVGPVHPSSHAHVELETLPCPPEVRGAAADPGLPRLPPHTGAAHEDAEVSPAGQTQVLSRAVP